MSIYTRISAGNSRTEAKLTIELRPYTDKYGQEITFVRVELDTHETTLMIYKHQHTFEELLEMFPTAKLIGVSASA